MTDQLSQLRPVRWRLPELMAARGIRFSAELHRRLVEVIGDDAPADTQVNKLVREAPVRLPLHVLAGLCSVLECTPGELLTLDDVDHPPS